MEQSTLDLTSLGVAIAALAAWLARELTFKQWRRHQSELRSILVGTNEERRQPRCLLDYIPSCALYKPDAPTRQYPTKTSLSGEPINPTDRTEG